MTDADVIIVGGAVAGGALANALGSSNVRTVLVEKVSREVHSTRGDLLHPPTLAMLERWGVLSALHADGAVPVTELAVSHARRGLVARFRIPGGSEGPAGRTIAVPHDRIEAVLYDCASRWPSVRIERGTVTDLLRDARGRVDGVRYRPRDRQETRELRSRIVVGCDGSQSLVRRSLGIAAEQFPYEHEQVIIGGQGQPELPHALHWYLDERGRLAVVPRPRHAFRILLTLQLGERGDLLRRPDPALHAYVAERFPALAPMRFGKEDAHLYRLSRHVADSFWAPGAGLVGDSAHATHPAGATGMSLAITGAARLAERLTPLLLAGAQTAELDAALEDFDEERRPAAAAAIEANHAQALRLWQSDLFQDPEAYARAVDPSSGWGVRDAGWGGDPAALSRLSAQRPS